MRKPKTVMKPPTNPIKSKQYDLFSDLNEGGAVSNTFQIWDDIPTSFFSASVVAKLRDKNGKADAYVHKFVHANLGKQCKIRFSPALIDQPDGTSLACFPGVTEELVEEALKKLLTDPDKGIHDKKNQCTWVEFTIGDIYRELKSHGKERNKTQIKHAIDVLSGCTIDVFMEEDRVFRGSVVQDLYSVDRKKYIDDSSAHHCCRLPLFISHGIDSMQYRQFNYAKYMELDQQLSRHIFKMLINNFTYASMSKPKFYNFSLNTKLSQCGLLNHKRDFDNRRKVSSAMDELKETGIISSYVTRTKKEGRKIVDVIYDDITPGVSFASEQLVANVLLKKHRESLSIESSSGVSLVTDYPEQFDT